MYKFAARYLMEECKSLKIVCNKRFPSIAYKFSFKLHPRVQAGNYTLHPLHRWYFKL